MTKEEMKDLQVLARELSELQGFLKARIPELATKTDVAKIVAEAMDKHTALNHAASKGLSNKQMAAVVSAGVALAGAITGILTGLIG